MALSDATKAKIEGLVKKDGVVLFMKGNKQFPQCGFSARVVQILDRAGASFETVNVLQDPEIREGIKEFSSWPTIPQLYVKGEFIGGCDIVTELAARGELQKILGVEEKPAETPTIRLSDGAVAAIKGAMDEGSGDVLRFEVSGSYQYQLYFAPPEKGDVVVDAKGVKIHLDPASARRANETSIAFVEGDGGGFKITNPNEPAKVKQVSAKEVKAMMDRGEKFELFDVRTEKERATAKIDRATPLDDAARAKLESMSKDTPIVFHCHHGGRSQAAAEHYLGKGFKNVMNLKGGIDAWSSEVDPKVPKY